MCPSLPASEPDDIDFLSSDEEVVMSLERMIGGDRIPDNVITGINPCSVPPWDLPDDMWFFFNTKDLKAAKPGYWKATGENHPVFTNSPTIGSRITLEFFTGQAPFGTKTDWTMHEYRIDQKGLSETDKAQSFHSLSRIFLSYGQITNHEERNNSAHPNNANENSPAINPEGKEENSQDSTSRSQWIDRDVEYENGTAILGRDEIFSSGDFLELLDLDIPESPSSSSANSSFKFPDEYFDASALLRDLEAVHNQDTEQKHTYSKYSVAASLRPNKVVMRPESIVSSPSNNRWLLKGEEDLRLDSSLPNVALEQNVQASEDVLQVHNVSDGNQNPSTILPKEVASSSCNEIPAAVGTSVDHKAVFGRMAKLRKKYWCFMPF